MESARELLTAVTEEENKLMEVDDKACTAGDTGIEEDGERPESIDTVVILEFERSTLQ